MEFTRGAFLAIIPTLPVFGVVAFARQGQAVFLDTQLDGCGIDTGDFDSHDELVFGIVHVHRGKRPAGNSAKPERPAEGVEHPAHLVKHPVHVPKW